MGQGRPGFSPPASALAEPGVELCVLLLPRVPPRPQPPRTGRPPRRYLVRPERCRLIDRPVPTAPRSHPSQREDCRRLVTRLTRPHCRRSSHRPGASPAPAPSPPPTAQTPAGTAGTARAIGVSNAQLREERRSHAVVLTRFISLPTIFFASAWFSCRSVTKFSQAL